MKIGFFEEKSNGDIAKSSIRLQMFLSMIFSFIVIGYQVYTGQVDLLLAITLLTASFTPKVVSKFAELSRK